MSFRQAKTAKTGIRFSIVLGRIAFLALLALLAGPLRAGETNTPCARAEAEFQAARARLAAAPENGTNAWRMGRTAFIWADCATNDQQRAAIAEEGIRVGRAAVAREPKTAAHHYYLAQNLGQLAQTKSLGALKLVREMEKVWLQAQSLDERLDFAGPDRSLGLLYLEAPGWPSSIGNNAKARTHLEHAVQLEPDYPDNRLSLAEALAKWHKKADASAQLKALTELWPRAKARFTGPEWEASWLDWETRLAALKLKAKQPVSSNQ